jgi:hypothetical protein
VALPVGEGDSLAAKVEALRLLLEEALGTTPFLRWVRAVLAVESLRKVVCYATKQSQLVTVMLLLLEEALGTTSFLT